MDFLSRLIKSHLIYCDDVLIFSNANAKSLASIKEVLKVYSAFLGPEVNQEQCFLLQSSKGPSPPLLSARFHYQGPSLGLPWNITFRKVDECGGNVTI